MREQLKIMTLWKKGVVVETFRDNGSSLLRGFCTYCPVTCICSSPAWEPLYPPIAISCSCHFSIVSWAQPSQSIPPSDRLVLRHSQHPSIRQSCPEPVRASLHRSCLSRSTQNIPPSDRLVQSHSEHPSVSQACLALEVFLEG